MHTMGKNKFLDNSFAMDTIIKRDGFPTMLVCALSILGARQVQTRQLRFQI